jgi:hypothetical protein
VDTDIRRGRQGRTQHKDGDGDGGKNSKRDRHTDERETRKNRELIKRDTQSN